jgi:hypothetical protein
MGNRLDYEAMTVAVRDVDWARLAAFIDGEGTIYINKSKRQKENWSPRYFLSVVITNTNPLLMNWLKTEFFGSVYIVKGGRSPLSKRMIMRWQLNERQAQTVLEHCLPYFVMKREQAEIGLAFMKLRDQNCQGRRQVSPEVLALRESFRLQIHGANQKVHVIQ